MVTQLIFLGFMDHPELQVPLFMLFLLSYVITLVGNLGMTVLIRIDSHLHTPLCFFLSNLSIVDVGYSSVIAPRVLMTSVAESNRIISFTECAMQFFFVCVFVTNE